MQFDSLGPQTCGFSVTSFKFLTVKSRRSSRHICIRKIEGINVQCFPKRWMISFNNTHWLYATWRRSRIIDDSDSVGISRILSTSLPESRERALGANLTFQVLLPLILSLDLEALLFKFEMLAFGSIWRDNLNEGNRYECDKFAILLFFENRDNMRSWVGAMLRALAFHQRGPSSISWPAFIRGLSLLVLYSFLRGFSPGTPFFPTPQRPRFDLISCNSVWFVVSSISKTSVLG